MKSLAQRSAKFATTSQVAIVEKKQLRATTALERDFAKAWELWYPIALDYAETLLEDSDLAADVLGDVSLLFFNKWKTMPLEHKQLRFFVQAVHNDCIDRLRRLDRQVE